MRIVMMYVGSFLLGFGMHSSAMDYASSMNQFYWDDLPQKFLAEVQEQEQKKPFRWSDLTSDSEAEVKCEKKKTGEPPLEFEIVGLAELARQHEQTKLAVPVDDEASDASSSFEQDYVSQGMSQLSQNKGQRVLARYKTLTVKTVNDDELKIFDGENLVYDGAGCRATHADFSPTHEKVTAACREVDGRLFFLTISLPNTPLTTVSESRPEEILDELPLVALGHDKVAVSDIGELLYLTENKVRVTATACCTAAQESDDESSEC